MKKGTKLAVFKGILERKIFPIAIMCKNSIFKGKKTMPIRIPPEEFPVLVGIVELDEKAFGALLNALETTPPSLTRKKYAEALSAKLPNFGLENISDLLNVLHALYHIRISKDVTVSELADDVKDAALGSEDFGPAFKGNNAGILHERIKSVLSLDKSLALGVKALNIMAEYERTFCNSRILSDIRPVFLDSPDSAAAAIIVHNLQIGFHDSVTGEHREIYIALDNNDVLELRDTIARAQKKAVALKSMLEKSGIPNVDV